MMQHWFVADGYGQAWRAQARVASREVQAEYREAGNKLGFGNEFCCDGKSGVKRCVVST